MTNSRRAVDPPMNMSKCHEATITSCLIMVILPNGTESEVGKIFYCSQDGWDKRNSGNSKPIRCYSCISINISPDCPITETEARNLFSRRVPTYWLSFAYHLTQGKDGAWSALRGVKGMPYLDEDNVVPAVRNLQRFKEFYPPPKKMNESSLGDRPREGGVNKSPPPPSSDYKSKAAGDYGEEDLPSFA